MNFRVEIVDRRILVYNKGLSVVGSSDVDSIEFIFDSSWDGLVKYACFKNASDGIQHKVELKDGNNIIKIPPELFTIEGELYIGALGTDNVSIVKPTVWAYVCYIEEGVDCVREDTAEP